MRPTMIPLAAVLLPGMAFLPSAIAAESTRIEQQEIAARTQDVAPSFRLAVETFRGVVDSVDEGSDTIKIRLSSDAVEQLRVQDGLLFNAVRYGDRVEVTVQTIAGAKTIVDLVRE